MAKCCKLLIVDDEFILRQGIKHMLDWKKEGFEIIGDAANGKEALELIKHECPHLLLTDVVMPQMDGIELAQQVQQKYPDIQVVVLSSYDDFDYVKKAFQYGVVDYILKPALNPTDLLTTLKKIAGTRKDIALAAQPSGGTDNVLNRLLLGFDSDIDFERLQETFPYPCFQLFGLRAVKSYPNYQQRHRLAEHLIATIDLDGLDRCVAHLTDIEKETLILLLNYDAQQAPLIFQHLKSVVSTVCAEFPDAFFVVSRRFETIRQIKSLYETSFLPLTAQQFYHKGTHLFTEQDVAAVPSESVLDERYDRFHDHANTPASTGKSFDYKYFSDTLSMLQILPALAYLKTFVSEAVQQQSMTEFEIKTLIQNALYNVIATLEGSNLSSSSLNALKHDYFDRIDNTQYAADLLSTLTLILVDLEAIVETYRAKLDSQIIHKIIRYIHDHFNEPLALADVAKMFNFNYYYLSSYFSNHNKEGFNEFLNKIRIEKATELLTQSIPISDISNLVGYSDHSYFCKVFKKFTGSTPSSYRKTALQG